VKAEDCYMLAANPGYYACMHISFVFCSFMLSFRVVSNCVVSFKILVCVTLSLSIFFHFLGNLHCVF
jgi:inner membrane protein involved in colicin E2 resistance